MIRVKLTEGATEFPSALDIGDKVEFRPMYKHQQNHGIADVWGYGVIVAVRFTKAKVFYDVVDDYWGLLFDNVDSIKVRPAYISKNIKEE